MKTSLLLSLVISIICSFTFILGTAPEPVLDISGQKLITGVKYYIVPVRRGRGGGLTLSTKGENNTCPLYVVQENEVLNGQPVTFTPFNAKNGVILTSTDLNIKSSFTSTTTSCAQSSPVWRLLKEMTGLWVLSTGGVEGNPGVDTINNWFKIEKQNNNKHYVLSFCPSVCNCQTLCRPLGLFKDTDAKKHLALSDKVRPFAVNFKRA